MTMASCRIVGTRSGDAIDAQRVDERDDEEIDEGAGEPQALERAQLCVGRLAARADHLGPQGDDDVDRGVDREQEDRELELPLDERG